MASKRKRSNGSFVEDQISNVEKRHKRTESPLPSYLSDKLIEINALDPSIAADDATSIKTDRHVLSALDINGNYNVNTSGIDETMSDNSNEYGIGDVVWAAAPGFRFWPAIVCNSGEGWHYKDGKIHVQFFYDCGRTALVVLKNSVQPYNGLDEFKAKCESNSALRLKRYKHLRKKWDTSKHRRWELAILEAEAIKTIDITSRIAIYDTILKACVSSADSKRRKSLNDSNTNCVDPLSNPTVNSIFNLIRQQCVCDEVELSAALQNLWRGLHEETKKLVATTKRKRSIGSCSSDSAANRTLTKRQLTLEEHKKIQAHKQANIKELLNGGFGYEIPNKRPRMLARAEEETEHMEEVEACFLKVHPANYLLRELAKGPVCEVCLLVNEERRCDGPCNCNYHLKCVGEPSDTLERNYRSIFNNRQKSINSSVKTELTMSTTTAAVKNEKSSPCSKIEQLECFVCKKVDNVDGCPIKCSEKSCSNIYHRKCLRFWPRPNNSSACSRHICHTCHEMPSDGIRNLMKCLLCPATYHRSSFCIPAGCVLLSESQLVCARHYDAYENRKSKLVNVDFCLICLEGGTLVCCDTCAYAFHAECLENPIIGDTYVCSICENGQRPLNGDIVWAKFRDIWWPAIIVPPPRIPPNVEEKLRSNPHQICVKYFDTYKYGFVRPNRIYVYDKADSEFMLERYKRGKYKEYQHQQLAKSIKGAGRAMELKTSLEGEIKCTPKSYKRTTVNRYFCKLPTKSIESTVCSCSPSDPCSPLNKCLNMQLFIECDLKTCPARDQCRNQQFRRGTRFKTELRWLEGKGFGLIAREKIPAHSFILEFVGEVIDNYEFNRRLFASSQNNDEHCYFLTLGKGFYIDAGPCGNNARFINHSCEPNAKPIKWIVKQQDRVGIFAAKDILQGQEITFDYRWNTERNLSQEVMPAVTGKYSLKQQPPKICLCGSAKCRGFM